MSGAPKLEAVAGLKLDVKTRQQEVVSLLRGLADDVESGKIGATRALVCLSLSEDPDSGSHSYFFTCPLIEAFGLLHMTGVKMVTQRTTG